MLHLQTIKPGISDRRTHTVCALYTLRRRGATFRPFALILPIERQLDHSHALMRVPVLGPRQPSNYRTKISRELVRRWSTRKVGSLYPRNQKKAFESKNQLRIKEIVAFGTNMMKLRVIMILETQKYITTINETEARELNEIQNDNLENISKWDPSVVARLSYKHKNAIPKLETGIFTTLT